MIKERRKEGIRQDLNNLVRDESGHISGSKIGTYAGQIISAKLLLVHAEYVIERWDALAVLFLVLIAPEAYKRFIQSRMGVNERGASTTRTVDTHSEETKKETITNDKS